MTRVAAIDAGSNAIRFVVADFDGALSYTVVHKVREPIRLGHNVFTRGGLDATDAIDTRSARYTRRRNMLENENNLMEGIRLAFHPFIEMQDWPGNPD